LPFQNVGVFANIITELKLRDIQGQIFAADFVEAANDAAFNNRPKAFDGFRVNYTNNVLLFGVVYNACG
jgi:hypothetical protein